MKLPHALINTREWTLVGPMGPEVPKHLLSHSVLSVDGGAHFTPQMDVWVGDADSFEGKVECDHIYRHPTQKDFSDLALALSLFQRPLHYKLHLWGFLGGRKDHELFNLGEGLSFLEEHPETQIIFYGHDGLVYFHLLGEGEWRFFHEGPFSLGTLRPVSIKLVGECQFPVPIPTTFRPLSSLGLSNQGTGEIVLTTEGPTFLSYPEGK